MAYQLLRQARDNKCNEKKTQTKTAFRFTHMQWHPKLSTLLVAILHAILALWLLVIRPYQHTWMNRFCLYGELHEVVSYASAYVAVRIDDPQSSVSGETFARSAEKHPLLWSTKPRSFTKTGSGQTFEKQNSCNNKNESRRVSKQVSSCSRFFTCSRRAYFSLLRGASSRTGARRQSESRSRAVRIHTQAFF